MRSRGSAFSAGFCSVSARRVRPGAIRSSGAFIRSTISSAALIVRVTCGMSAFAGSSSRSSIRVTRTDTSLSCSSVALRLSIVVINCSTPRWNCWKLLETAENGLVPNIATRSPNPADGLSAMRAPYPTWRRRRRDQLLAAAKASRGSQVQIRLRSP